MLADLIEEDEMASSLPKAAHAMFRWMLDLLAGLNGKIADLDKEIARRAREDEVSRRLLTVPGIGPISATAIAALAPPAETFAKGRDFAAWLGLTPLQRSTGGKQKLGATACIWRGVHRHSHATLSMRLIGFSACSRHFSACLRHLSVACAALVEAMDLAPTFVDWFGGKPARHTRRTVADALVAETGAGAMAESRGLGIRLCDARGTSRSTD